MGEKSSQLRYVYDDVSIHVRERESSGVTAEQYGGMLLVYDQNFQRREGWWMGRG